MEQSHGIRPARDSQKQSISRNELTFLEQAAVYYPAQTGWMALCYQSSNFLQKMTVSPGDVGLRRWTSFGYCSEQAPDTGSKYTQCSHVARSWHLSASNKYRSSATCCILPGAVQSDYRQMMPG